MPVDDHLDTALADDRLAELIERLPTDRARIDALGGERLARPDPPVRVHRWLAGERLDIEEDHKPVAGCSNDSVAAGVILRRGDLDDRRQRASVRLLDDEVVSLREFRVTPDRGNAHERDPVRLLDRLERGYVWTAAGAGAPTDRGRAG